VLVTGRQAIRGSDRILAYAAAQPGGADLMPADRSERADVQRWLDICDRRLGIDTRRWIYSWVLDDVPAFLALLGSGLGDRGRRTLARVHPAVRPVIRRAFRVGAAARRESEEQVAEVFAQADAQRGGSPYLVGDRFTGADLTFAALSAPMVGPPQYGVPLPAAEELPPDLRAAMERWRATPSGAAVLAIYERHRLAGAPRPTPTTPGGVTP
jgi:glutathione S-transferase